MQQVSIFNDVIGPVMRGPSSSHCAAALRIGRLAHDLLGGPPDRVQVIYDPHGSLATTHASQGSDMGLCGGLLGWEATDARLPNAEAALAASGVRLETTLRPASDEHPNTYWLDLSRGAAQLRLKAISTGGGMIAVLAVDDLPVTMTGGAYETLLEVDDSALIERALAERPAVQLVERYATASGWLVRVASRAPLDCDWPALGVRRVRQARPVLPVLDSANPVPFTTCAGLLAFDAGHGRPLWELACAYEGARADLSADEVQARMGELLGIMRAAVARGLAGTVWADRMLGPQAAGYVARRDAGGLLPAGLLDRIIPCVTALMEAKSALEVVVAAPTAGSCGALPGAVLGAGEALGSSEVELARALLAGGLIGVFIATRSTFAAEVCGCQAECGAASGMAAAALAQLGGGTLAQCLAAASLALQNVMGMVCDPVANRVEAPCLGKNVLAASNALACANMALAGYDPLIPLDEVIAASDAVGRSLPPEVRCTALGGLSITPTSLAIARRLARQQEVS